MTQPQRKAKTDWSAAFTKPETASRSLEPVSEVDVDVENAVDVAKPAARRRGPYNVKKVDKKPATFRLPPDVHELIDRARQEAADNGIRLTKDDAVTAAVRHLYGRKRR